MTRAPKVILGDFETKGIEPRPNYPPKPVSLALRWPGGAYEMMAWGHEAGGNNCTEKAAKGRLKEAYASGYPVLWQNGMFDVDVADVAWGLGIPEWRKIHDTMFLIFLWDPHSPSLGLKESAERLLGTKPEERDALKEWILENVPEAKRKPTSWGAYIWKAPYSIVKPYHKGDLTRMGGLFDWLWPRISDSGMLEAYDRERRLMPILLRNARRGMRIDVDGLDRDIPLLRKGMEKADAWLHKRLGDINLNSPKQLGDALYDKGIVTNFRLTAKGQRGTGKTSLTIDRFKDKKVYQAMTYKSQLETCLGTFMEPWRELAGTGDRLFPDWSQVRSAKGDTKDTKGARSGRIIGSKPNFLNLPKKWKKAVAAGYVHPAFLGAIPELPFVRRYALPDRGKQWGRRDWKQQEIYCFAYFEEGPVQEGLLADPVTRPCIRCGAVAGVECLGGDTHEERDYDIHENVRAEAERALIEAGLRDEFERDLAKNAVFARLYGQGLAGLIETLKLTEEDKPVAQVVRNAINTAIPSIKELDKALKDLALGGSPIRTWGGRLYYVEEPKYVERFGRDMEFYYKLLNYLCQGSGADITKETLCLYDEHPKRQEELIVTVYDENNINLPLSDKGARQEMTVLKECMSAPDISPLKLSSGGETGPSWGALKDFAI